MCRKVGGANLRPPESPEGHCLQGPHTGKMVLDRRDLRTRSSAGQPRELWVCTDGNVGLTQRVKTALGISSLVGLAGPPQGCDGLASIWPIVKLALCSRDG